MVPRRRRCDHLSSRYGMRKLLGWCTEGCVCVHSNAATYSEVVGTRVFCVLTALRRLFLLCTFILYFAQCLANSEFVRHFGHLVLCISMSLRLGRRSLQSHIKTETKILGNQNFFHSCVHPRDSFNIPNPDLGRGHPN